MTSTSAVAPPRLRGLWRWYAVLAGIGWWLVHIGVLMVLAPSSGPHPGVRLVMHATTVVTALGTVAGLWLATQMARQPEAEDQPDAWGRQRFLGLVGLLVGGISLLLILWEGAYVLALGGCLTNGPYLCHG